MFDLFSKNEKLLLLPNKISSELNILDKSITANITNVKLDINTIATRLIFALKLNTLFIRSDILTTGIIAVTPFSFIFGIIDTYEGIKTKSITGVI